jgi:hypothetical protein
VSAALPQCSAHARPHAAQGGRRPVAIASVTEGDDGLRVAIGSVEAVPRAGAPSRPTSPSRPRERTSPSSRRATASRRPAAIGCTSCSPSLPAR